MLRPLHSYSITFQILGPLSDSICLRYKENQLGKMEHHTVKLKFSYILFNILSLYAVEYLEHDTIAGEWPKRSEDRRLTISFNAQEFTWPGSDIR